MSRGSSFLRSLIKIINLDSRTFNTSTIAGRGGAAFGIMMAARGAGAGAATWRAAVAGGGAPSPASSSSLALLNGRAAAAGFATVAMTHGWSGSSSTVTTLIPTRRVRKSAAGAAAAAAGADGAGSAIDSTTPSTSTSTSTSTSSSSSSSSSMTATPPQLPSVAAADAAASASMARVPPLEPPPKPHAASHPGRLSAGDDVAAAVEAAAAAAGRGVGERERELVARLRDNWFATAGDLAAISADDAAALRVPLRLRGFVARALGADAELLSADEQWGTTTSSSSGSGTRAESDGGMELEIGAAIGAAGAAAADELPADIMQRRAPPRSRAFPKRQEGVIRRPKLPPYGLRDEEITPALADELAALHAFSTGRFYGQRVAPVSAATVRTDVRYLKLMLGWLVRHRGVDVSEVSLRTMFPSADEAAIAHTFDFTQFLVNERHAGPRTVLNALSACLHAARFLYHGQSKPDKSNPRAAPYADLPLVRALKSLIGPAQRAAKRAPLLAEQRLKWLEWPEYLALVRGLRAECAGLTAAGAPRSRKDVALSLQRYLIFAILSCIPDRQRTLRELEVGRTLVRDDGGGTGSGTGTSGGTGSGGTAAARWVVRHTPADYKTGKMYGERPPLVVAPFVYPELEAFISEFRAELKPRHNFLFSRRNGEPLSDKALYDMFVNTAQRRTGRATNPHLVRDMVVTHLRGAGTSEAEMEALAIYMGHSVAMQRDTYDRRTRAQKVLPAVALMDKMTGGLG